MNNNNKKLIQILRGAESYNVAESFEILADGQPFYSKKNNQLYIGDGNTPLKDLRSVETNLNLKNGDGINSLTSQQSASSISYTVSSNGYIFEKDTVGALAKNSVNLTPLGCTSANNFLNIGNLNVVECNLNENDDGGVIAGYKHYSDSRATSLFGGWHRAINSGRSLITGYRNTAVDAQYNIISGQNNLVCEKGTNSTFGYDLINKWNYATVIGRNNDPVSIDDFKNLPTGDPLKSASPLFIVGDGNATPAYLMQNIKVSETGMSIDKIIEHNNKYKESPLGEGLYFRNALANNKFSWADLILSADNITNDTVIYRRDITNRSNAMVLMSGGRLFLPRKGLSYKNSLRDNEIPIKSEIEERLHDLDFLSYEISPASAIVEGNIYSDVFVSNVKQSKGQIEITTNNRLRSLRILNSPEHIHDVIRKQDLDSTKTELTTRIDALEATVQRLNNIIESLNIG